MSPFDCRPIVYWSCTEIVWAIFGATIWRVVRIEIMIDLWHTSLSDVLAQMWAVLYSPDNKFDIFWKNNYVIVELLIIKWFEWPQKAISYWILPVFSITIFISFVREENANKKGKEIISWYDVNILGTFNIKHLDFSMQALNKNGKEK